MKNTIVRLTAFLVALSALLIAYPALAATPTLSITATGSGDSVQINVTGDHNASVILGYNKLNVGQSLYSLGSSDNNGNFSTIISSGSLGATAGNPAYVVVNSQQSATVTWPSNAGSGQFSLSQTGLVMSAGQTALVTANNATGAVYLSNNSNPPIANINISGSQINITALANGSTVVSICSGSSSTCASLYLTIGSSNAQALTFSISNVTVSPGQSVPITVSGGTGTYTILSNSNSAVIQAGVNGSSVTLTTSQTSGAAAITVCSSDMSSCGIINAAAGTASSSPIAFSQNNPALSVGQSLAISVSGGFPSGGSTASYYISNNSNSGIVQASIAGSNLTLTGSANGTATVTVCSSAGSCGSLTTTVSITSVGGSLQLSQTTISLLVGQVLTVTVSGGTSPYSLSGGTGSVAQTSLSGNIVSISGLSAGSSNLNVCSSGGACLPLTAVVNASGAGTQLSFSQNNLSLSAGGSTSITITGAGGYYSSNSTNPGVASVQITGSTALVTGQSAGNTNISICQSGGQCAILFVSVGAGASSGNGPTFSQTNPNLSIGQILNILISGGSGSNYYVLTNTSPAVVQSSLNNSQLTLTGLSNGSSTVVICAAASSCSSLIANVGTSSTSPISLQTSGLPSATAGQPYAAQVSARGGSGSYAYSLSSGKLPAGLVLSGGGVISGTPNSAGTANFTVTATDTSNSTLSASANLTLSVSAATSLATATPSTPSPLPAAPSTYSSGQLISENGTVYIVYLNTKVGFANSPAFLGLGYLFANVSPATNSGLTVSPKVVVTAQGGHPRGAWLLGGKTVYFLTPNGLIPVPDWNTFLSNGGQASFIVKANSYDLSFTKLSVMTANDSRLKP
jgi:hypothetical protein